MKLLSPLSLLLGGLVIAGCGGSSPAGGSPGAGGSARGGNGAGGNTSVGTGGTSATGTGGTSATGTGGITASGSAGTTGTGAGGTTGSGSAGTTGSGSAGTTGSGSGGTTTTGAGGTTTTGTAGVTGAGGTGGGKIPIGSAQCSDGRDNDNDGKIDYDDPECVGPLDNDESSFATGIPGDNMDACRQDCFFDGNSGMGDDHCLWQLKCDPRSTAASCPYDAQYAQQHASECSVSTSQSQACINNCRRLVPNGCDCFGCCAVPGAPTPIRLAPTCTAADFNDPTKCPPCTQVTQCNNTCERCEVCIGKPTVPADCQPPTDGGTSDGGTGYDGGVPVCEGALACGPGTAIGVNDCPSPTTCITGCCIDAE